jgi:hypothetical protein
MRPGSVYHLVYQGNKLIKIPVPNYLIKIVSLERYLLFNKNQANMEMYFSKLPLMLDILENIIKGTNEQNKNSKACPNQLYQK